ncbi:hypothetical protein [Nocardia sp. XZ_19_385]|uniref:hypothetical protein n=1 Tax=Nocardia sp. XZ_19_385 TaxID=2769488 RepID=UPI00188EC05E|nr:hypothetical protein [Nocardia sp. XZ_19_385]
MWPRLRRATWALLVAAFCTTGLSISLLIAALWLNLSAADAQFLERLWWAPLVLALAVAGL